MKTTSRSSRLVSSAARSPALAMTGPEVERNPTPSSRAMIWASVVLPRPARLGGLDEHLQVRPRLLLADELAQVLRAQGRLCVVRVALGTGDEAVCVGHGLFCERIRRGGQGRAKNLQLDSPRVTAWRGRDRVWLCR